MKYWLGVVSREHVLKGVLGGFAQVCHGKKAPLLKMAAGDGFLYYSPKMALGSTEICKRFTALGTIRTGNVYQVEMFPDFHPFRIDVDYVLCREVSLVAIFEQLELTRGRSWGMQLRRGLLEISAADFEIISKAMS
ncbi:MAG: EVE domain-containing protein [Parachlamydia sp.]|nr:EVE domain-containing protein [Parachlamydia sp.]